MLLVYLRFAVIPGYERTLSILQVLLSLFEPLILPGNRIYIAKLVMTDVKATFLAFDEVKFAFKNRNMCLWFGVILTNITAHSLLYEL